MMVQPTYKFLNWKKMNEGGNIGRTTNRRNKRSDISDAPGQFQHFNPSFSYNGTLYNFRKLFNSCFRPVDHCHGKISIPESRVDQKMYVEQIIFFL